MTGRADFRGVARRAWRGGAVVMCAMAWSAPALAQKLGQGADDDISVWRVVAALLLCLVLAVAGAFALRARGGGIGKLFPLVVRRSRRLQVVETVRLGPQADLSIVTGDGRELLVASSPHGVSLLRELPFEAAQATPGPGGAA